MGFGNVTYIDKMIEKTKKSSNANRIFISYKGLQILECSNFHFDKIFNKQEHHLKLNAAHKIS